MAIYDQPTGGEQLQPDGRKVRILVRRGPYAEVLSEAGLRPRGTLIPDVGYVMQWQISRGPGGSGVVTYTCADVMAGQWQDNSPLADTWSLRNTQITHPLSVYCGPSQVANAQWRRIQQWAGERDNALYSQMMYRTGTTVQTLTGPDTLIAGKIMIGIEEVQRHYPVAQRLRLYSRMPSGVGANLDHIEEPAEFADAAPTWLKVQDDVAQNADGSWTRTEQWLGAETLDHNLYGSGLDRWVFGSI